MKITDISTEWADGIKWNNENLGESVWDGFYVMFEVEDKEGNKFNLQYIAASSVETERDYENNTEHEKLEKYDDFLDEVDELADKVSELTINIEISEKNMEEKKEELAEILDIK